MTFTPITETITACRDPKDDKFLELAVSGQANLIISSDNDLLVLYWFFGMTVQKACHPEEPATKDLSEVQHAPRRNRCLRASVSINDRSFLPSVIRMTSPLACTVISKNRYQTLQFDLPPTHLE